MSREPLRSQLKSLVSKFEANKYHYLSKNYLEEEVKIDFMNPLFEALGWDVRNTKGLSPFERDVVVEKGETLGRPDYNFRIDGLTKFFIEVKAPHEPLHKINHVLQAKSYAWNTKSVFFVLLADFEEFRLFDATIKPDPKNVDQGLVFELTYDQYLDNLDKLSLLSKEEVEKGSLDKLLLKDSESKRLRKPVDEAFLEDISKWREELAKDIYKRNIKDLEDRTDEGKTKVQVKILNEAVQKILDRLIFIRIAEDRKIIEPKSLLDEVEWWKAGGKRRNLHKRLTNRFLGWNQDFNGEILKPGPCDVLEIGSNLLSKIIESLYFPKCLYLFDVIGVELLGSIYERYLGKTIRVTPKRIKIEEKPEVRKAGGVYYTPQYIVDYIIKNTVDKVIKGKKPKQIEKIKILDPACGSGSFLLTAYQTLIDYHLTFYEKHPEESGTGILFPDVITDFNGKKRLSIEKKALILRNNIFGVDIDPQAVEIAMMSLYLKCLEGEKDLPRKKELLPSLARNIRCGNSLISYDILDQMTLFDDEEKDRINPFDWYSKSTGFGQIIEQGGFDVLVGNPPYIFARELLTQSEKKYFINHYNSIWEKPNTYMLFMERGIVFLKSKGLISYIVPNSWLTVESGKLIRNLFMDKLIKLLDLNYPVFDKVNVETTVFVGKKHEQRRKIQCARLSSKEEFPLNHFVLMSQDLWIANKGKIYICSNLKIDSILTSISNNSENMGDIYDVRTGLQAYEKGKGIPKQTVQDVKDHVFDFDYNFDEFTYRYADGKNIKRYHINWSGRWLRYGKWLSQPRTLDIFTRPRLLIREITSPPPYCINTGYINDLLLNNKSILNILDHQDNIDNLLFLLAQLNSRLISLFYQERAVKSKRTMFPKVVIRDLRIFPCKSLNSDIRLKNSVIELVRSMLKLQKKKISTIPSSKRDQIEREILITDEKIDELVYELYGITKEEIKIIEEGI